MSKFSKVSIFAVVIAIAVGFAFSISPVQAMEEEETFDLFVSHNINGLPLGLDRSLPVDVYVNGAYAFTFELGGKVKTSLPAGEYYIEVKPAGSETAILSLDAGFIPAGVDVSIFAKMGSPLSPYLQVKVK